VSEQRRFLGSCNEILPTLGARYGFVIADPPYSRAGAAHTSTTTAQGKHSVLAASDQFWEHWFSSQWRVIAAVCESWACAMVFCDYRTIGALERAIIASESGWSVTQCAVWDRGSIGLGSPMRARHELMAFVRGPSFKWDGRKDIANVFECDWPYGTHPNHPAEKPVRLLRDILQDFAHGRVLDPFCGSGSSGVAARALDLGWDGIEQDAPTAKIASERLGMRARLFQDTVLRRREGDSQVYLMNRQRKGWGEYAIPYRTVGEVELFYHVTVGEWGEDEHGPVAPVRLLGSSASSSWEAGA
jgi:site-specific DNA-methyltransferase (adenine-specific)